MKAAVLEKIDNPLVIADVNLGEIKFGQVLVKINISGICGAQLQEIAGKKGNSKFVPHLLGHEGCGVVEQIGEGVTKVKPGDKVILHWKKGDGIESPFPEYFYDGKRITSGKITTLSEKSIVSENRITPVPTETPDEFCALMGCGLSTAFGIVNYDANIKFGETVLIIGCGGVGLNIMMACNIAGSGNIYGVDISSEKEKLIQEFGGKLVSGINQINQKIDCIIDTTGNMEVLSHYLPILSSRGRCIIVSQPNEMSFIQIKNPSNFFAGNGQIIRSTQGGNVNPTEDFPRYINLYNKRKFDYKKLITHTIALNNVNEAINLIRNGKTGRVMVNLSL